MAEYINRDAYIRYLSSRKAEFVDDFGQGWCAGIETAISACEKFPAAEVAPVRHGRWEYSDYYDIGDVCSECLWDSQMVQPSYRYCPNCGAKMDEKE